MGKKAQRAAGGKRRPQPAGLEGCPLAAAVLGGSAGELERLVGLSAPPLGASGTPAPAQAEIAQLEALVGRLAVVAA